MTNYVGIVRSDVRLERAKRRLEIIFKETEELYLKSTLSQHLCELRNMIAVGYLIIKQAEAYRESKINEAEGQATRFTELFAEYQNYPLITKQRLFYEAMEEILPDMKLYIVDEAAGVQTSIPLEPYATLGQEESGNE